MNSQKTRGSILIFKDFQLNVETGELSDKNGEYINLQQQPAKVLTLLAEHSSKLITREEIQHLLWQDQTFVDYEQGINYCIKQIRIALNDDAKNPRFVETLPRRGYRFVAKVEGLNGDNGNVSEIKPIKNYGEFPTQTKSATYFGKTAFGLVALAFILLSSIFIWNFAFGADSKKVSINISKNPESQDAYLKGKYWFDKGEIEAFKTSIKFFDQAILQDENFASAYLARADAFYQIGLFGGAKTKEVFPNAKTDALRAFELNNDLADAQTLLGSIAFRYEWNWEKAEKHFKQAIRINQNSPNAYHDYAWLLVSQKRFDEAIEAIKTAQKLDPISPRTNTDVGWIYMRARRYDTAISQMQRTLELQPDFIAARQCLECAYFNKAMYRESVKKRFGIDERIRCYGKRNGKDQTG